MQLDKSAATDPLMTTNYRIARQGCVVHHRKNGPPMSELGPQADLAQGCCGMTSIIYDSIAAAHRNLISVAPARPGATDASAPDGYKLPRG